MIRFLFSEIQFVKDFCIQIKCLKINTLVVRWFQIGYLFISMIVMQVTQVGYENNTIENKSYS